MKVTESEIFQIVGHLYLQQQCDKREINLLQERIKKMAAGAGQAALNSLLARMLCLLITEINTTPSSGPLKPGAYVFDGSAADTFTLENDPVAGDPSEGGDDGNLYFVSVQSAHAHVFKTASAAKINGADQTATSAGVVGNSLLLMARNGVLYVLFNAGFTLS